MKSVKSFLIIVMVVLCINYVMSATETNALPITPVSVDASSTFSTYMTKII